MEIVEVKERRAAKRDLRKEGREEERGRDTAGATRNGVGWEEPEPAAARRTEWELPEALFRRCEGGRCLVAAPSAAVPSAQEVARQDRHDGKGEGDERNAEGQSHGSVTPRSESASRAIFASRESGLMETTRR